MKVLTMLENNIDNTDDDEPLLLKEAMASPHWPKWLEAMLSELNFHNENGTWDLVDASSDHKVLIRQWIFKFKKDHLGNILKYKAQWVVHSYKQKFELDYEDTFTTVVKPMSYKTLLAISAFYGLNIQQMDIVTAFLLSFLDETIYVKQPHYFAKGLQVCHLHKALYGLKQSPWVWYMIFMDFLHKLDFHRSKSDHEVFISENQSIFLAVYVDDLLLFGLDTMRLDEIQHQLSSQFKMTDLNEISHYLGMEVDVTDDSISICQTTYIKKILNCFKMFNCNPASIFMMAGLLSTLGPFTTDASSSQKEWYQSVIESLIWLSQHTQPDISFVVAILSKYCSNSNEQHCKHVWRVLAYLNTTLDHGLTFTIKGSKDLINYSDSDFADAVDGCKSTEAFVFMLAEGSISHQAKQQSIIALSSYEAKYIALCEADKEAI